MKFNYQPEFEIVPYLHQLKLPIWKPRPLVDRGNVMYQTQQSVSSDIQTLRRGLKKRGAAEFLRPTWLGISDEALFRVFEGYNS